MPRDANTWKRLELNPSQWGLRLPNGSLKCPCPMAKLSWPMSGTSLFIVKQLNRSELGGQRKNAT